MRKSEANIITVGLLGFPFVIKSVASTALPLVFWFWFVDPVSFRKSSRMGPLEGISAEKFSSCPY